MSRAKAMLQAVPASTLRPAAAATTSPSSSPYKTIDEAAEYLRVTPWAIAQAIRTGDLPRAKIGKRFVLRVQELDDYFKKLLDVA